MFYCRQLSLLYSLEKANNQLLYELRERELEYNSLQEEVRDLNERLVTFRKEHAVELGMYLFLQSL